MLIRELFEKPIHRPINGVIKADQKDDESVWQELDEYVITRELDIHLRKFFDSYLKSLDLSGNPDVTSKIGVWVSGFFGSGKSHFIKVLSYLLSNHHASKDGVTKRAIEFFEGKVHDAMLAADIKRAVSTDTDVILFNIDSKADTSKDDPILTVFLNVFNGMLGYCPDHPHIADMERVLDAKGKLSAFHAAYRDIAKAEWVEERDAFYLNADSIKAALARVLGQSESAFSRWLDDPEAAFHLSPENFAGWVKQYLDAKGPKHRIVFLVDEIGQFIGQDTHMMLRLQTITENLGTVCQGRAWVIVTSQEDIEAVLGDLKAAKNNDFSKIQGRFRTRLSLSSANVDEVIQARLLTKTDDAKTALAAVYKDKADILKHQLSFTNTGMTFRAFANDTHFAAVYPFAPYQFQLVQKIFEAIRRVGATGLHLARGERSMLDAFQSAATQLGGEEIGVLVPLYRFYASIESFLDTAVKATIDNAADNPSLEPFDGLVLRTLFLIRYVDEIKGNVDNLVTLFIDRIDADRLALRNQVEASLQRLEGQTLVRRNGDEFFFLTDEEREIGRGIKAVDLSGGEEVKKLGDLIFDEVLGGNRKHRFEDTKKDFVFNRFCDQHPHGSKTEGDLAVSVITPLSDDYADWNEAKCLMQSNADGGQIVVKLRDDRKLGRELRTWLQTEKFIARTNDGGLPASTIKILRDRADENRTRWDTLIVTVRDLLKEADFYAAGQVIRPKGGSGDAAIREALDYLIRNTFTKLGLLKHICQDPQTEIRAVLTAPDTADQKLNLDGGEGNAEALKEVLSFVRLKDSINQKVILHDLIEGKFGKRPYGWPEWDVALLVVCLMTGGEVSLVMDGATLSRDKVAEAIKTPNKWRSMTVVKRQTVDAALLQQARSVGKTVFAKMGPDGEDALHTFLRTNCDGWVSNLTGYLKLAETGNYPGKDSIEGGLSLLKKLLAEKESYGFIKRFVALKDDMEELSDRVNDLDTFYGSQRPVWDTLRQRYSDFQLNKKELDQNADAAAGLDRMRVILNHTEPYSFIKEINGLIAKVGGINDDLVAKRRSHAVGKIDEHIAQVKQALEQVAAPPDLQNRCLQGLQAIRASVLKEGNIARIFTDQTEALDAKDTALDQIEGFVRSKVPQPKPIPEPVAETAGAGPAPKADPPPPSRPAPATPIFKKPRVVTPAAIHKGGHLKTKEDVEQFLATLRKELEDALAKNEPIEIR
ncbi:BREX system P-loop protein BrxC [Azospirillum melinis]